MFNQDAPVKQAFAGAFSGMYSEKIKSFNKYQFVAILVLHQVYDSWMLSYHIISNIITQLHCSSYEELKADFMEEIDEYKRTEFADHADFDEKLDENKHEKYLSELSLVIDKFVYYFTLK